MVRFIYLIILFQLIFSRFPAYSQALRFFPVSFGLTQTAEYPSEQFNTRAMLTTPQVRAAVTFQDREMRTWTIRLRPCREIQILGGSIATSGVPARAKNLINPIRSPHFRPVTAQTGWLCSPGTTLTTSTLALEAKDTLWHLAAFGDPEDPLSFGTWTYAALHVPDKNPFATGLRLSLFSGLTSKTGKENDAWFIPEQRIPETVGFFPAGELAVTNTMITGSISGFRNISRLKQDTGAFRAEGALKAGRLTLAGSFYQSDYGFCEFDGSVVKIRERRLLAPSFMVPLPGMKRTVSRLRVLYARDVVSPDKRNQSPYTSEWYGTSLSVENPAVLLQGMIVHKKEALSLSGKASLYRFILPFLRMDIEGKGELPDNASLKKDWLNLMYLVRITMNAKQGKNRWKTGIYGKITQKDRYSPIMYNAGGLLSTSLVSGHTNTRISVEGNYSTEQPHITAKIYVSGLLRF